MSISFAAPFALLLLLLIPCFIWCKTHSKHFYFAKIAWLGKEASLFNLTLWLKIAVFSLMVVALAQPFSYDTSQNNHKRGRDLVLAIDASGSMAGSGFDSKDRFKSRYELSIELAKVFIKNRSDDNVGAVIFGTFAYTASPLTYDLKGVSFLLEMSNVGIAGESTAIGDALMQSLHTLKFGQAQNRVIVLLTDGEHNAGSHSPKEAVDAAKKENVKVYTIGIGKKSDYDAALLDTIAKETGGQSYAAQNADDLAAVYRQIDTLEPSAIRSENYLNRQTLFFYPLSIAALLLLGWTLYGRGIRPYGRLA